MKKIIVMLTLAMLCGSVAMAQKEKPVAEKDVKMSYVKDFERQVKEPSNVAWYRLDSLTFKVRFTDSEQSKQAMVFSNRGTETHYFIDTKWTPHAIADMVKAQYAGFTVEELWVRKVRNKMTYQVRIVKKGGFLWWKKVKAEKLLDFETADCQFIGEAE